MRILITGVSGLLGNNLAWYFRGKNLVMGFYNTHPVCFAEIECQKVDLLDVPVLGKWVQKFEPEVVIHCAGLTNLDFCEKNQEAAFAANVKATRNLVATLKGSSAKLVYISSDAVYDGKNGNYREEDPVEPMNYYGRTKYEGERESERHGNALILRTNIFGWNVLPKESLAEWMVSTLMRKELLRGFSDAFFSPIYTFDMASILERCLQKNLRGLYHCGSSTSLSKYEFVLQLSRYFGLDASLVQPCSRDEVPLAAKRGKNLSLCSDRLSKALDVPFPSMKESIKNFHRDFERGLPAKIKKECLTFRKKN